MGQWGSGAQLTNFDGTPHLCIQIEKGKCHGDQRRDAGGARPSTDAIATVFSSA